MDDIMLTHHIIDGKKETIPNNTPLNIQHIIRGCWKDNPQERIVLVNILEIVKDDELNSLPKSQSLEKANEQSYSQPESQVIDFGQLNLNNQSEQNQEQQTLQIQSPYGTPGSSK